jgi:predicted ATPase
LLFRLGTGGSAEVWAAHHEQLGVQVALKLLGPGSPALRERLLREGRAQAILDHPHVLPVRDLLQVQGILGLVLPLVEGPSLADHLKDRRPSGEEAIELFRGIASGVAHAHAHGLIHRDLKPANVLLDPRTGQVVPRVSDFGIVKGPGLAGLTLAGTALGTLGYMAPEQLTDAAQVGFPCDVFSLGVVGVELLTGRCPFAATSVPALILAHQAPVDLNGVPPAFRPLLAAMLDRDPAARPADAATVVRDLDSLVPPPPTSALIAGSPLERAVRTWWQQRVGQAETGPRPRDPEAGIAPVRTLPLEDVQTLPRHNLGPPRGRLIGRTRALADLDHHWAQGARLVTLVGPGGVGKTTLALHHGQVSLDQWPGGVWFCDASEARDAAQVAFAVGRALSLQLEPSDPIGRVAAALAGRGRCLLILDNVEQVVEPAAATVMAWLSLAPELRVLVTSRERLHGDPEWVLLLDPLPPDEAIVLYELRSLAAGVQVPSEDRADVAALVELVDGLPLAIELAAARARLLSPAQLVARMGERFRWLGTHRGGSERQATLRATIDWSWHLLDAAEQTALAQLAVFVGGFSLEAAESVLLLDGARWPIDVVHSLVDKSLVRPIKPGRFDLLHSVYAYAREKLLEQGSDSDTSRRHGAYYRQFGQPDMLEALHGPGGARRIASLADELANLLAAAYRAVEAGDAETAGGTALAAWAVIEQRGPLSQGVQVLEAALTVAGRDRARLARAAGEAHHLAGHRDSARERWEQALAESRASGDRRGEALAWAGLGHLSQPPRRDWLTTALVYHREAGDLRQEAMILDHLAILDWSIGDREGASAQLERALGLHQRTGNRRQEAKTLGNLGALCVSMGQYDRADRLLRRAYAIHIEVGNRGLEGVVLGDLGNLARIRGEPTTARELFEKALRLHRETGKRYFEGVMLSWLGVLALDLGNGDEARERLVEGLDLLQQVGGRRMEGVATTFLAMVDLHEGRLDAAYHRVEAALVILREVGFSLGEGDALSLRALLRARSGEIAAARRDIADAERLLRKEDPLLLAQALCRQATVERWAGDRTAARAALEASAQIAAAIGIGSTAPVWARIAAERATLDPPP